MKATVTPAFELTAHFGKRRSIGRPDGTEASVEAELAKRSDGGGRHPTIVARHSGDAASFDEARRRHKACVGEQIDCLFLLVVEADGGAFLVANEKTDETIVALVGELHHTGVTVDHQGRLGTDDVELRRRRQVRHDAQVSAMGGAEGHDGDSKDRV